MCEKIVNIFRAAFAWAHTRMGAPAILAPARHFSKSSNPVSGAAGLTLACVLALACLPVAPQAAEPLKPAQTKPAPPSQLQQATREELQVHQLGITMGYVNYCLKKAGIKTFKDPEAKPFAEHYGEPFKSLGPKGVQLYRAGVKKGVFNGTSESGEYCRQNLQRIIKLHQDIGLNGNFYTNALRHYSKP